MDKKEYIAVSFSGGKDSTAMLLRMIELNEHIDEVIFCDTYKEFPQMYDHIERIKAIVEENGIKFTTIKNAMTFDYLMFEYEPKHRNPEQFYKKYGKVKGKSWASSKVRWCTGDLKSKLTDKYFRELNKEYSVIQCLGIAADETKRLERKNQLKENHRHPLVEWGWTETDCLEYCYAKGFDWGGLYEIFSRVSCWCCPLQPLEELRKLKKFFPDLWEELREMDRRTWRKFKTDYSVDELEIRFAFEEERLAENKSIRNREFFNELRAKLQEVGVSGAD